MSDGFDAAMKFTGLAEGGYTNLPGDKGGETNWGISDARDGKLDGNVCGVPTGSGGTMCVPVKLLSHDQALAIYRKEYWDSLLLSQLSVPVAVAVFDYGVNSGTGRAAKALQRACGVAQDGVIGAATVGKANALGARSLAAAVCDLRIQFLQTSPDSTIAKYRASLVARAQRCKAYTQTL